MKLKNEIDSNKDQERKNERDIKNWIIIQIAFFKLDGDYNYLCIGTYAHICRYVNI